MTQSLELVPIQPDIEVKIFRGHELRIICNYADGRLWPHRTGDIWPVAQDHAAPCNISRGSLRDRIRDLEPSEKGVVSIDTLGGPQEFTIVNESASLRLIAGSRTPEGKALLKWMADLAVSYRKGQLTAALDTRLQSEVLALRQKVEFLERSMANEPRAILSPDAAHPSHLFPYSIHEVRRLQTEGFWITKEWLENERVPSSELSRLAASLVRRAKAHFAKELQLRNKMTRTLRRTNPSGKRVWLVHEKYLDALHYGGVSPEDKAVLRRRLEMFKRQDLGAELTALGDQQQLPFDVVSLAQVRAARRQA